MTIEVGKIYRTEGGDRRVCIGLVDGVAWLALARRLDGRPTGAAYSYDATTGKAVCLCGSKGYDLICGPVAEAA